MTEFKDKMAQTADKAKEAATSTMHAAGEAGRRVTEDVKSRASETMETVRDAASDRADSARDKIVGAGERLADTLHQQAAQTEGVSSRVLEGMAGGVSTVTDGLRGASLGDLFTGAQDYARRHPATFAVGAAVAGFALARFLRSSSERYTAEQRAAETTDRMYRDAARRTMDTLGHRNEGGHRSEGGPRV